MAEHDRFDNLSPLDHRYWDEELSGYLSENAFVHYKLQVELALLKVLARRGICSESVFQEIERACGQVTTEEVYEEERRIGHDVRALVNCIQSKVGEEVRPFVHMTATSYDIVEPANALRYKEVVGKVLAPSLKELESVLINTTIKEAETIQIGRTHGQHAVPITFGFAMAEYVSRLGQSIENLEGLATKLPGKFSGAVGAYNASSLFFEDPEGFEKEVLAELGLIPAEISTQIASPEPMTRLFSEVAITAGILANLADDMRHLQRTEIGEVGEKFGKDQVGSSTMPQKQNPINFENIKSTWKIVMPRMMTLFMDQISEHQRDLTNSASARTYGEIIAYVTFMAKRLSRTMGDLTVNRPNMERNFAMSKDFILAEPLYLLLAALGHPDAHEKVRQLTLLARSEEKSLQEVALQNEEMRPFFEKMTPHQRQILSDPSLYTGIAAKKAKAVAGAWKEQLKLY